MLIGLPITPREGLPKTTVDVFNWFNKRSKIEVTLGDVMTFYWENISVASWKSRSLFTKILKRSHSSDMSKEIPLPSLRQVVAITHNNFLLSHVVVIMTYVEFHLVETSMVNKFCLTFYTFHIILYTNEFFAVYYLPQEQVFEADEEFLQMVFVKYLPCHLLTLFITKKSMINYPTPSSLLDLLRWKHGPYMAHGTAWWMSIHSHSINFPSLPPLSCYCLHYLLW